MLGPVDDELWVKTSAVLLAHLIATDTFHDFIIGGTLYETFQSIVTFRGTLGHAYQVRPRSCSSGRLHCEYSRQSRIAWSRTSRMLSVTVERGQTSGLLVGVRNQRSCSLLSLEQRLSEHELCDYAPDGPYVDYDQVNKQVQHVRESIPAVP